MKKNAEDAIQQLLKNKNLNSKYTDGCEWIVPIENRKDKHES